jgi:hypothetical protein
MHSTEDEKWLNIFLLGYHGRTMAIQAWYVRNHVITMLVCASRI